MTNAYSRFVTALFCLFLGGLLVWHVVLPDRTFSPVENRNLAQFPTFSWKALADGTFTSDVETYLEDQFPRRAQGPKPLQGRHQKPHHKGRKKLRQHVLPVGFRRIVERSGNQTAFRSVGIGEQVKFTVYNVDRKAGYGMVVVDAFVGSLIIVERTHIKRITAANAGFFQIEHIFLLSRCCRIEAERLFLVDVN